MSMWDFLNWLELRELKEKVGNLKYSSNHSYVSLEDNIKRLFLELYRNGNDISKINLGEVTKIKNVINSSFNSNSNRTAKEDYSIIQIIGFFIFTNLLVYFSIKEFLILNNISFFTIIISIFLFFIAKSSFNGIKETFYFRKKYDLNLKENLKEALVLKQKYPYLTPYELYLKYTIDSSLIDIINLLKKDKISINNDPYNTLKIFYSLFDLNANTELLRHAFFMHFNRDKYKMLKGTFTFPKSTINKEKIFIDMLIMFSLIFPLYFLKKDIILHIKNYGELYFNKKDYEKALPYLKIQCLLNDKEACYKLSKIYLEKKDYKEYIDYKKKACNLGYAKACIQLGLRYEKYKYSYAMELYKRACDLNSAKGCIMYAGKLFLKKRYEESLPYFKKGCLLKDGFCCFSVGVIISEKYKLYEEGKKFYKKACDLGYTKACNFLN